jgi:DNA-binding CsgD family transcriptional regulator
MQAEIARAAGDIRTATRLFAEALVRAQVSHNPRARIPALIGLGDIASDTLTIEEALHHYRDALEVANEYSDDHAIVRALERIALLGTTLRVTHEWIGILGLAQSMRRRLDLSRSRLDEQHLRPRIRHARELLGSDDFDRLVAEGEGLTLESILATLETTPARRQPNPPPAGRQRKLTSAADMLTPREREVVQQISKGHTNRQIAAVLGMSERTVDTHVSNIRQKLQLPSRARIAVWAVAQGLSNLD